LRQALGRGHEVAALISPEKTPPADLAGAKNLHWRRGTLAAMPESEIASFAPEVCVHSAWITTPGVYLESPDNLKFLEDSRRFIRRAVEMGVRHVVALGTCLEYGVSARPMSEDQTPLAPATLYARCKNDLRTALEADARANGWALGWARVFYPYGPGEHPSRLCSAIIRKISAGEKIILKTPCSAKDYIYIADLGTALVTVMEKKFQGAINLGTGHGVTVREIAGAIGRRLGRPELVSEANPPETDPAGDVVADAARLKSLGWQPKTGLGQGLAALLN
jgi:nucleoside-diphosphate-sugar epimerase